MNGYLLAVKFEGNFGANSLKLPPVLIVEGLDHLSALGLLDQWRAWVLLTLENGDENLDPSLEGAGHHQVRLQSHGVAHVENLGDQDQYFELVVRESLFELRHHHRLQVLQEVLADFYQNLSLVIHFVLEGSDQLLEGS